MDPRDRDRHCAEARAHIGAIEIMQHIIRLLAATLAITLGAAAVYAAEFSTSQKDEIGQIVREYLLKNPEFAATLRATAERGAEAFYKGAVAEAIVKAVREAPNHRGDMTAADLAGYAVKEREPVCVVYRRYRVCGMGPPSSGGLAVAQVLKLIEPFELGKGPAEAMNGKALHLIAEAEKLAFLTSFALSIMYPRAK